MARALAIGRSCAAVVSADLGFLSAAAADEIVVGAAES